MKNLFFILSCLFLFQACQPPATETEQETETTEAIEEEKQPETYRALKANVVYTLKEGEEVTFLDEKSEHTEKITLRGQAIQAPWFKVETKKGQVGWVFGGALISTDAEPVEGQTSKRVKDLKAPDLSKLIGLSVGEYPKTYEGKYGYFLSKDKEVLHGKFKFVGKDWIEDYQIDVVYTYQGQYDKGVKFGLFSEKVDGIEGNSLTRLFFEGGKCTWGDWEANAEGESYENRVEKPEICEFAEMGE